MDSTFQLGSSIPVLRMLDETKTKSFYLHYLGYTINWEHRFRESESSPLYAQVSQGESVLHLNGHADENSPTCEVRVPVQHLDLYCEYLCAKEMGFGEPSVDDPRYEGRNTDMNLVDPSGSQLVFWSPQEA